MTKEITLKQYVTSPSVKSRIEEVLKDRASQFVVSLLSTVNTNPKLAQCNPISVVNAAMTAASLNLPINQNLGFAYIIPYKDQAQFQMGYKGFIQLAQRSNQFKTINVEAVFPGEITHFDRLTGEITFDWLTAEERAKNKPVGYVGYIELINGFRKTMYMTMEELKAHGLRYSQSMKKGYGLWIDDFDAMAKKTVIKLLLSKYAPLTTEMETATLADQSIVREDGEYDYIDNEPDKAEDIAAEKERVRLTKHITDSKTVKELEVCDEYIVDDETRKVYDAKLKELSGKEKKV